MHRLARTFDVHICNHFSFRMVKHISLVPNVCDLNGHKKRLKKHVSGLVKINSNKSPKISKCMVLFLNYEKSKTKGINQTMVWKFGFMAFQHLKLL